MDKGRIVWLDYARAIAILCVVITHAAEGVYSLEASILAQYTIQRRLFVLSVFTIGRLGVPLFFFLTGYLLLDREYPRERTISFIKKNFCGLLITTAIWIVIYNIFRAWFCNESFDMAKCFKTMFFLKTTKMSHMWYMPVIIGIYLFIPFVANALKNIELKVLLIPLAIVFVYQFILPTANVYLAANGFEALSSMPDLSFGGNKYGFLIIVGYMVKKGAFDKIPTAIVAALGILGFIFTVFTQDYSDLHGITYTVWYNSASLVIADLAIFILLSRMHLKRGKIAGSISKASFGIYLIHNLIKLPLLRYYQPGISCWERLAVVFIITFCLSWAITAVLGKIEFVSQVLLFQKPQTKIIPAE